MCFDVTFNGVNVNKYIDRASLEEISIRCEGEDLWSFWTDTVNCEADLSILKALGSSPESISILENIKVRIFYYGELIFTGIVGYPEYDSTSETVYFEFFSNYYIINNLPIDYYVPNFTTREKIPRYLLYLFQYNATPEEILTFWKDKINTSLSSAGYPFSISGINVDATDFTAYKSLNLVQVLQIGNEESAKNAAIEENRYLFKSGNRYFAGLQIKDDEYFISEFSIETGNQIGKTERIKLDEDVPISGTEDEAVKEIFFRSWQNYRNDSKIRNIWTTSILKDGDIYYCLGYERDYQRHRITAFLLKFQYADADKYYYEYFLFEKKYQWGTVLKHLAIMTDKVIYINPFGVINLVDRNGQSGLNAFKPIQLKTAHSRYTTREINLPFEFWRIPEDRQKILNDYFGTILNGDFNKYVGLVEYDKVSNLNLVLKKLPISGGNAGLCKSVTLMEDLLKFESEERII